jgi:hypothetical protein
VPTGPTERHHIEVINLDLFCLHDLLCRAVQEERYAEIERDNRYLLEKMSHIMRVSASSHDVPTPDRRGCAGVLRKRNASSGAIVF